MNTCKAETTLRLNERPQAARGDLFARFKSLGWGEDTQSVSIFNFLMAARERTPAGSILLDLGAGQCRYRFFFEHCNYIAVDFAKSDARWDFGKLDIIADINRLDFIGDATVDFCLNTTTLEHLSEPWLFFEEVGRILKPGGRLFLYVPFVMNEHQAPYDFYRYTSYGLRHLCKRSGLEVISLKPSNGPLFTAMVWVDNALRQAEGRGLPARILLRMLRWAAGRIFLPLFDKLDKYSATNGFPQCWLLEAAKPGVLEPAHGLDKKAAIDSILRRYDFELRNRQIVFLK